MHYSPFTITIKYTILHKVCARVRLNFERTIVKCPTLCIYINLGPKCERGNRRPIWPLIPPSGSVDIG